MGKRLGIILRIGYEICCGGNCNEYWRREAHCQHTLTMVAFRLNAHDTLGKDANDSLHCCSFAKGTPWFSHGGKSTNWPLLGCITSSSSLSIASSLLFVFCANPRLLLLSNNGILKTSGAHLKGQILLHTADNCTLMNMEFVMGSIPPLDSRP